MPASFDEVAAGVFSQSLLEFATGITHLNRHPSFSSKIWNQLTRHPGLVLCNIFENPHLPWDWNYVSRHPGVTMADILAHPELPWDVDGVACNPNCTLEFVLQHPEWKWDWVLVTQNPNITIRDLTEHPELPWRYDYLRDTPSITNSDISRHAELPWAWREFSTRRTSLSIFFVVEHSNKPWDWNSLSARKELSFEEIKQHPHLPWVEQALARRPDIPFSDLVMYLWKNSKEKDPLIFEYLSCNQITIHDVLSIPELAYSFAIWNIPLKDILRFPKLPWDWYIVSSHPQLSMALVLEHPSVPWVWDNVTKSPGISSHDIHSHPRLPWSEKTIWFNPNLTFDNVESLLKESSFERNLEFWCLSFWSRQPFLGEQAKIRARVARIWMAVYKIKRWWVGLFWSPVSHVGKKRLAQSYDKNDFDEFVWGLGQNHQEEEINAWPRGWLRTCRQVKQFIS